MLLRWRLAKSTLVRQPRPNEVANWFAFVANNFINRGTRGLGSVIGLLLDTTDGGQLIRALEIGDWPEKPSLLQFELLVAVAVVIGKPYLPHR